MIFEKWLLPLRVENLRIKVVVPTYNGGSVWQAGALALASAAKANQLDIGILVVDSSSRDQSAQIARDCGFDVIVIDSRNFDHGGTRNTVVFEYCADCDVVVFLTQDAIVQGHDSLERLVDAFSDTNVAVAYGRQLPHTDANPIAAHARWFNYGAKSYKSSMDDRSTLGLKAVFTSNAFAAYRLSVFRDLGGFPEKTILSEDMYFAARAVSAGYKVAYVADAAVRHSHNYKPIEEFKRYFDIGVFQCDEAWIGQEFGGAGGEGKRFLISEARYLMARAPLWIPRAWAHDFLKIAGYKLGKNYKRLPARFRRKFSMNGKYWGLRAVK